MEKLLGTILGGPIGGFLTSLLSAVIRPIIEAQIAELKEYISDQFKESQKFKEFDKEVDAYLPKLANATLSEDRWALVQELKNKRANLTK